MYSVMYSFGRPPGNHGHIPSGYWSSAMRRFSRAVSASSRLASNRMPTFCRACPSFTACRTHGVSSSSTAFRSAFFWSGLSSAGVPFHRSNTRRMRGSELPMCRASPFA